MFSEILRIKPVLDTGSAVQMEASLTKRFQRIATSFGRGLKNVLKISALGLSFALLQKLLSPLTDMEERIKKLLGDSQEASDLAERLHTQEGPLRLTQGIASSFGVKPDELKGLLLSYAKAVESARAEHKTPQDITSDAATTVQHLMGVENLLVGFQGFLSFLKAEPKELAAKHEKAVFGEEQFGAAKKFLRSDFGDQANKIKAPGVDELQNSAENVNALAALQHEIAAGNELRNFTRLEGKVGPSVVEGIEALKQREEKNAIDKFDNFENIRKGAESIENIKQTIEKNLDKILGVFALIEPLTRAILNIQTFLDKMLTSRWWKDNFRGKE